MMNRIMKISFFTLVAILLVDSQAQAQWNKVKKFIQKDVQVVKETKEVLILYHSSVQDTIVLSKDKRPDSDIYSDLRQRRGGNPYRVWVATEKFRNPDNVWVKFLRPEFLGIIRRPEKGKGKSDDSDSGVYYPLERIYGVNPYDVWTTIE